MLTKTAIPTLKADNFQKLYSSDHPDSEIRHTSVGQQEFEIHRRCVWPQSMTPHRLDKYMIFMNIEGESIHTIGDEQYLVKENTLCFVSPEMIRSWKGETELQNGFVVMFSDVFFYQGCADKKFLEEFPLFQLGGTPLLNLSIDEANEYMSIFKMMHKEYRNKNEYSSAILRSQLQLFIHKANAKFRTSTTFENEKFSASIRLVKSFKKLFTTDFMVLGQGKAILHKNIAEYADALGVTQNHLNDTVKQVTGRSAGQLIRYHLALHATSCLMHSEQNISEIAYKLGFEDPAYFARFYKNQTGKSPTEFRLALNP